MKWMLDEVMTYFVFLERHDSYWWIVNGDTNYHNTVWSTFGYVCQGELVLLLKSFDTRFPFFLPSFHSCSASFLSLSLTFYLKTWFIQAMCSIPSLYFRGFTQPQESRDILHDFLHNLGYHYPPFSFITFHRLNDKVRNFSQLLLSSFLTSCLVLSRY